MKMAVYPGSFDPLTNGHVDIVERGLKLFDTVVVSVGLNRDKGSLFTVDERVNMIRQVFAGNPRVQVDVFRGLLMDHVQGLGASAVIRGLRAVSDFEYEFQMANMNRKLCPEAETIFLMTGADNFYLSSSLVKEVAALGAEVKDMVPAVVLAALNQKYGGAR
jgi:pantetheine-phosphate adenylyltransferase